MATRVAPPPVLNVPARHVQPDLLNPPNPSPPPTSEGQSRPPLAQHPRASNDSSTGLNVLGREASEESHDTQSSAGRPRTAESDHSKAEHVRSRQSSRRDTDASSEKAAWRMRHGWNYNAEQMNLLRTHYYLYYNDARHELAGNPNSPGKEVKSAEWRMKDRLKTGHAVLALCLNIGVDPPDITKPHPCARLECWVDPNAPAPAALNPGNTGPMSVIARNLQKAYEQISVRTKYRVLSDPTIDEMKKHCVNLRKSAGNERILFHYNGHGVPKPTASGEIWVFNKTYTQYIPISLYELQAWLLGPTLFVWDCSDAGFVIKSFNRFLEARQRDIPESKRQDESLFDQYIHLLACSEGETLPINPMAPADLFTSCLTTPINISLRFYILHNPLQHVPDDIDALSVLGKPAERKTPMGELNWIFTAITDTIAWNTLPKDQFKKLFRQDLMIAALFRNFLLAQRIMRRYGCNPQSYPAIPWCHDHPLWENWDSAIELVLHQLPYFATVDPKDKEFDYEHSNFFEEQLQAFQTYLDEGASEHKEPEQLPVVLQVLLSQQHRLHALRLLSNFLDLGPWAVKLALGIGIFPYVLKLLQSSAPDLKPVMVFIWTRILAVDQDCQQDLLKDNCYQYFTTLLNPAICLPTRHTDEHRAMCAFISAMFCKDHPQGQDATLNSCHSDEIVEHCLVQMKFPDSQLPSLRQWCCLCLSMLWKDNTKAKWAGLRLSSHNRLGEAIRDPVPEVRAAMLHALKNLVGIEPITEEVARTEEGMALHVLAMTNDGSNIVRKELVIFFSVLVSRYENKFLVAAFEALSNEHQSKERPVSASASRRSSDDDTGPQVADSIFSSIWKCIMILTADPDPEVSRDAKIVVDYVMRSLVKSALGPLLKPSIIEKLLSEERTKPAVQSQPENRRPIQPAVHSPIDENRQDGYFSAGLRRTASVAASIRNMAFGPSHTPERASQTQPRPQPTQTSRSLSQARLTDKFTHNAPAEDYLSRSQGPYQTVKFPLGKYFRERSAEEGQRLPLTSSFFDWSTEYFREPQMKSHEADEPGSNEYNERLWRRGRNEDVLSDTQKLKEQAASNQWDRQVDTFQSGIKPYRMCFHQYDDHLAITDELDNVRIMDWKRPSTLLSKFSNGSPHRSKITGTRFINEDDRAILMTGSSDGVIRLFRNYDKQSEVYMAASFRALTDMVPSTHNAGLVFDWLQGRGQTLVAGDAKVIRIWSAAHETCELEIPARSGSCVTSLTSDQVEGSTFVAGFGDGALRVYDQRLKPTASMTQQWKEHGQWITNVHMQRGGQRELVSGCRDGEIKLWDIRMQKSLRTIKATKGTLRTLSVHEHAPIFAIGTERHKLRVFNMDGLPLSSFEPSGNLWTATRNVPVSALAFHPHRMMLAASSYNDGHVNLYTYDDRKPSVVKEA